MTDTGARRRTVRRYCGVVLGVLFLAALVTTGSAAVTDGSTTTQPRPVTVVNASTEPNTVPAGEGARTEVRLRNTGQRREVTVWLRKEGNIVERKSVTVPANDTKTVRLARRYTEVGDHELTVQLRYTVDGETIETERVAAGTVSVTGGTDDPDVPAVVFLLVGLGVVAVGGAYYALSEGPYGTPKE